MSPYFQGREEGGLPRKVASAVPAGVPVRSSASQAETVLPVATNSQRSLGFSMATGASPGDWIGVQNEGVTIGRACASVGPGALLQVGSTNGRLAPAAAGASGVIDAFVVGESVSAAADGDYFSVRLTPDGPTLRSAQ
jgi:hypothetical protein